MSSEPPQITPWVYPALQISDLPFKDCATIYDPRQTSQTRMRTCILEMRLNEFFERVSTSIWTEIRQR